MQTSYPVGAGILFNVTMSRNLNSPPRTRTSAQRYNARMHAIFERAKVLKAQQPTERPWKIDEQWGLILGPDGQEIAAIHAAQEPGENRAPQERAKANRELIVRAVNNHDALIEALEALLPYAEKLFEASGAIDGLLPSRITADHDLGQARTALEEARAQ